MFKFIFRSSLAITPMLLSVTAQANGINKCEPVKRCPCPSEPSSCCESYENRGPSPCCPTICRPSPYSGPYCIPAPYCNEIRVWGEGFYWIANLEGLESAFGTTAINTSVAGGITTTTVTETDREPEWDWRPGFRVGIDYAWKCFIVEANWTHYDGRAHFSDGGQYGKWKIDYNTVDLLFGRRCNVAPCFFFKPFIGVRGALFYQKLDSHLQTFYTSIIGNSTVTTDKHDKEHTWGVGPELGVEADWYIGCNWTLYASFDFVTYYGHVKTEIDNVDRFTSTVSVANGTIRHAFNTIATDGAIGIRWDKAWPVASEVLLTFKLGLEQHRIFDFSELGSDGALNLAGANLATSLGYRF